MLRIFSFVFLFIFSIATFATPIKHVIYITFDGTKWQDILLDHSNLKTFWEKYADKVTFYGMPNSNTSISVASIAISLPSYQSQMSGAVQSSCIGNECGRIKVETFPEAMKIKLGLAKKDIAVFSSWYEIAYSAEHLYGSIYTNTGNFPVYDPDTQVADNMMYQLNMQQTYDTPGESVRYDKYTFAQAMHYFETYQPRFLWISLNNADEAGHANDIKLYRDALRFYDEALDVLFTKLKAMNIDKETMVIVTTDHGRGDGILWTSHGPHVPSSKQTWAFVMNGKLKPMSQSGNTLNYSTLSIRPTVEEALGV